jgi:hypothetical protein
MFLVHRPVPGSVSHWTQRSSLKQYLPQIFYLCNVLLVLKVVNMWQLKVRTRRLWTNSAYLISFPQTYSSKMQCVWQKHTRIYACVTIDRVWIGYQIYWPLVYITQNYTDHWHTQSGVLSLLQSPLAPQLLPREILSFPHSDPLVNWQLN